MKKEMNINKRAEKIVYKLLSNPNKTIYFSINGEKYPYRVNKLGSTNGGVDIELLKGWAGCMYSLVFLNDYKGLYFFYKSYCKNEIELAIAKEFMKEIKKRLDKEIVFVEK